MRFIRGDSEREESPKSDREFLDQISDPRTLTSHIVGSRPRVERKSYDLMHISQMDTVCPREYVIGNLSKATRKETVSYPLQSVFNIGSAMHYWIQNHPDSYFGRDKVLGYWYCLACGNTRRFGVRPVEPCEFCGAQSRATVYKEYSFRLKDHGVTGSVDLILKVGSRYRFVDLKTTAKEVLSPIGSNVVQLASYMYFAQADKGGLPLTIDSSLGYLVYFNKMFNFKSPVTTFKVQPTDRLMKPIIEKSRQFVEGIATSILPEPKPSCVSKNFYFAESSRCPMVTECSTHYFEKVKKFQKSS